VVNNALIDHVGYIETEEYMELLERLNEAYNNLLISQDTILEETITNFPEEFRPHVTKIIDNIINPEYQENMIINSRVLMNFLNTNIKVLLSRLKNSDDISLGNVSKKWRITPDKEKILKKYLKSIEFSQYTFKPKTTKSKRKNKHFINNSLYKYVISGEEGGGVVNLRLLYKYMYDTIVPCINNIRDLIGMSGLDDDGDDAYRKTFTDEQSYYMIKYVFLTVIYRLSKIIKIFMADSDDVEGVDGPYESYNISETLIVRDLKQLMENATDIYPLFNIEDTDAIPPGSTIVSKMLFDMLYNIYMENNESESIRMFYNEDELDKKIAKEKEREKASVVDKLTTMDHEKRGLEIQLQEFGIKNIYKTKESENMEWIQTDAYQEFRMESRSNLEIEPMDREEIFANLEHEDAVNIEREDETDNMGGINPDEGYDNADFADDELDD